MAADLRLRTHFFNLPDPRPAGPSPPPPLALLFIPLAPTVPAAPRARPGASGRRGVSPPRGRAWWAPSSHRPKGKGGRPPPPSHAPFEPLLRSHPPRHFAGCLASWTAALAEGLGIKHVAIDG